MKRLIVVSLIMTGLLVIAGFSTPRSGPRSRERPEAHVHRSHPRPLRQWVARVHRVLPQGVGGGTLARARRCFYGRIPETGH